MRHSTQSRERLHAHTCVLLSANKWCRLGCHLAAQGLTWSASCLMLEACVTALFASKLALRRRNTMVCE